MRTHPLPRLALVGLTALSVVACSSATAPPDPVSPPRSSSSAPPSSSRDSAAPTVGPAARPPLPGTADEPSIAWLLVSRRGQADLHLVLTTTGEVQDMAVPDGAPAPDWRRVVTATPDGASTVVRDLIVQPGSGGPALRLDGHWRLPTVGLDPIPAGRSADGSTIALVEGAYDPSAGVSRFAIVDHFLVGAVQTAGDAPLRLDRVIELRGAFDYDALSPDGRILYVVQHLDGAAGGHYQVRAVDVATGLMREGVIVDKTHPDELMAASPLGQERRPDGLVLTLYRGPDHPFIHALESRDAWAVCIDLPVGGGGDPDASLDWGLAPSADGASVFAVNASLGLAVEVDAADLSVRRSASIGSSGGAPIVLAKFGHGDVGPVGRRVVASPDGTLLFAAGANGITAIRTLDLAAVRRDLIGTAVDSVGITPDGRVLFALARDATIVALDAATGQDLGAVPGHGYDRLLAVVPW